MVDEAEGKVTTTMEEEAVAIVEEEAASVKEAVARGKEEAAGSVEEEKTLGSSSSSSSKPLSCFMPLEACLSGPADNQHLTAPLQKRQIHISTHIHDRELHMSNYSIRLVLCRHIKNQENPKYYVARQKLNIPVYLEGGLKVGKKALPFSVTAAAAYSWSHLFRPSRR